MKKTLLMGVIAAIFCLITLSYAGNQDEFCAGFAEGYKAIRGNNVAVPACPAAPATPANSTPFQEGLKAGMAAASRR